MQIDDVFLKEIAEQFVLKEELYINDALSLKAKQPLIVTKHHIKMLPEYNLKCFFELISISDFDVKEYNIQEPYEYLKNVKISKTTNGRLYDTYLGDIYHNLFYTVMYAYVVDFNKYEEGE